jgi:hypothetical protein
VKCGQEIHVQDMYRATSVQFVAQCEGIFIIIAHHPASYLNGYRVVGWHAVLRELVALAVPAKLVDRTFTAESTASGQYVNVPLTYPLSVDGLARLLDAPADEVRAQLADLAVSTD